MVDTASDQESNRIRQISVFLPNLLGSLLGVERSLETANIKVCGLTIMDAIDHAVVRMIVDQPTLAKEVLVNAGYGVIDTELLGVLVPDGGIRKVLTALLRAELNINYAYALFAGTDGRPALAVNVEQIDGAARILVRAGMALLNQDDLM